MTEVDRCTCTVPYGSMFLRAKSLKHQILQMDSTPPGSNFRAHAPDFGSGLPTVVVFVAFVMFQKG